MAKRGARIQVRLVGREEAVPCGVTTLSDPSRLLSRSAASRVHTADLCHMEVLVDIYVNNEMIEGL